MRVWFAAAIGLLELCEVDPSLPLDPELFVASQPLCSPFADPWTELTGAESARRYVERVTAIVRSLREELNGEVRLAERRIAAGQFISRVLGATSGRISPLARYIVAVRASRERLMLRFLEEARIQHFGCPLYRPACAELISASDYPLGEGDTGWTCPSNNRGSRFRVKAQWN